MKEFLKKNWQISLVGFTTLILAVIALATAWRLYQVGKEPIAPTAPTSFPQADEPEEPLEEAVCTLEFTIEAISCYDACTVDTDCPQNFGDDEVDLVCDEDENICVNESCSDEDDCVCPEAISCYDACTVDTDCPQNFGDDEVDLVCDEDENICVNESCSDEDDCVCPEESHTPTPTPSPSPSVAGSPVPSPSLVPSPSPQQVELPEAGIISPTILATLGGIILVLIGLLL